ANRTTKPSSTIATTAELGVEQQQQQPSTAESRGREVQTGGNAHRPASKSTSTHPRQREPKNPSNQQLTLSSGPYPKEKPPGPATASEESTRKTTS
ncbi:hypothetical protein Ancab_004697, partial [Ancistrocladus abbreviatus]